MLKSFSIIVLVACVTADRATSVKVRYVSQDDTHLIETGPTHFAIASPKNIQSYWKAVYVNNNEITVETENCEKLTTHLNSLGDDQKNLFLGTYQRLSQAGVNGMVAPGAAFMRSDFEGSFLTSSVNTGNSFQGQKDGYSFQVQGGTMNIHKADMPLGLERVFVVNDQAALVYKSGDVKMASISCLSQDERRYVHEMVALVQNHFTIQHRPVPMSVASVPISHPINRMVSAQALPTLDRSLSNTPQLIPTGASIQPVAQVAQPVSQQTVNEQSQQSGQQQNNQQKKPMLLNKYLKRTVNFVKDLFGFVNKGLNNISSAGSDSINKS